MPKFSPRSMSLRFNWRNRYSNPEQVPADTTDGGTDPSPIEQWTEELLELVPSGFEADLGGVPQDYDRDVDLVFGNGLAKERS